LKTTLITVGRLRSPFTEADAHYRRMLGRYQPIRVVEARDDDDLMSKLPDHSTGRMVALDRGGEALDSVGWSRWLDDRRLEARDVALLIGGPDGLPEGALDAAQQRISLGPQTLAHQLARLVVLEQLFRAAKILAGEPYHR
jgi:23S rRNA (pseudouridine1915-N3)-methyltransferase